MNTPHDKPRPISIPHLVFGVLFTGIAAVWAIGQATDADLPRTAIGIPVVLILAGVAGLVASFAGARQRTGPEPVPTTEPDVEALDAPDTNEEAR